MLRCEFAQAGAEILAIIFELVFTP